MENHIEFNRSNWNQVLEFTNNLAKDLIIERCINGSAYCKVPTREGFCEVKEGQFINKESDKLFYIMNPPPGYKSNINSITLESVSNTEEIFLLKSHITKLEAENKELRDLLYRWSQLNDPQDFYVCSPTLKDDTEQAFKNNQK